MPLALGTRIGPYEILSTIGAGGMGEVYRARDTRLNRDVAIKVLPDHFAGDAERLARFEREAQILASLNHPQIAHIHGLEESGPVRALVMELVEGEALAEKIARGPLPLDEAHPIARQIAEALEAAHEAGIIHRDLKPANIKVTSAGTVKVLDFGLAKAVDADGPGDSRTVTAAGTRAGVILGTTGYMSPEQVRGQAVDKRTDIWAFGCVLYEMLTGRMAFPGQTLSDTFAAVLSRDPDWGLLPETTPAYVRTLLLRCLEKDSKRRLRDIGDARLELDAAVAVPATMSTPIGDRSAGRALPLRLVIVAILVIGSIVALAAWVWWRPDAPSPAPSVRMAVRLAPGVTVARGPRFASSVALSPDGRMLVIAGKDANGHRLYQRPLDRLEPTPLAGTEGGSSPFFSRDGSWIGFFVGGHLKRVPAGGGAAVDIAVAPATQFPNGSWGPDDRIVFSAGSNTALHVVDARGGNAEPLTTLDAGEFAHGQPEVLPDGGSLLFTVTQQGGSWIHALDLKSGRRTALVQGAAPRYASPGHLILSRGTALLAASFDPSRLEITGAVAPFVEDVAIEGNGARHYAISPTGTLAYVPGARTHALVLVGKDGTEQLVAGEHASFENPQFSPDGRRLVVATTRRAGEAADLWVHDRKMGTASRLTFDGGRAPVWTRDGTAVTYSHLGARPGIYTKAADGRGEATQLVALDTFHWLVGWSPDARSLVYGVMEKVPADGTSTSSIMAFAGERSRRIVGPGQTWGGRLSPDGELLAYYSLESGGFEVYVTPFPQGGTRWLIAEGTDPKWAPDGTEVYYRSGDRLMAARVDTAAGVQVLSRRLVIEPFSPPRYDDYDIHPDGRTLVMVRPVGDAVGREVTMVLNWFTELPQLIRRP